MEHSYATCDCFKRGCMICGGGLAICTVCLGAEGSLTTECCGRKLTETEEIRVMNLSLDFKDGKWVRLNNIPKEPN